MGIKELEEWRAKQVREPCRICEYCERIQRNPGRAAAFLGECFGVGAAKSGEATKSLPSLRQAQDRCIDMDFAKTIPILVASKFSLRMIARFVCIAPSAQMTVGIVFVGIDLAAGFHPLLDDRLEHFLLHIRQHLDSHFPVALQYAEDRWFLFGQRAAAALSLT